MLTIVSSLRFPLRFSFERRDTSNIRKSVLLHFQHLECHLTYCAMLSSRHLVCDDTLSCLTYYTLRKRQHKLPTLWLTARRHSHSFTNLEFQIENQNLTFALLETIC